MGGDIGRISSRDVYTYSDVIGAVRFFLCSVSVVPPWPREGNGFQGNMLFFFNFWRYALSSDGHMYRVIGPWWVGFSLSRVFQKFPCLRIPDGWGTLLRVLQTFSLPKQAQRFPTLFRLSQKRLPIVNHYGYWCCDVHCSCKNTWKQCTFMYNNNARLCTLRFIEF